MIKIIDTAYKNLGHESDFGYTLLSQKYINAAYFMENLDYTATELEIHVMNGLEFYKYFFEQVSNDHTTTVHDFRKIIFQQKYYLQECCKIILENY